MQSFDLLRRKVRKIIERLHRSNRATEQFEACQKRLGQKVKKLKQEVETRWNSCFLMLDSFRERKDAVILFLGTEDGADFSFTAAEWKLLDEAMEILKPLFLITEEIS